MRRLTVQVGFLLQLAAGSVFAQEPPPTEPPPDQPRGEKLKQSGFDLKKFENSSFDPKQIEQLESISRSRQEMISKLEQLLRDRPLYDNKAEIFFRLGEAYWEEAHYQYLKARSRYEKELEAFEDKRLATKPVEPKEDFAKALDYYRKVIQQFPDYARIDEVMYYLGRGALSQGKELQDRNLVKEGVTYFQKLVQNYPRSRFIANAYLELAEHFFETDSLYYAKTNYEKIINNFPQSPMFNYALYKLGWVYFNLREFPKTIETFQKVVSNIGTSAGVISFRDQALDDLVKTWAEMEDSWRDALDYFKSQLKDENDIYKRMETLASLYVSYDKDKEALELYNHFIDHSPTGTKVVDWLDATLSVQRKVNDFGKIEAEIRRILGYFEPSGRWMTANANDADARASANKLAETNLLWLANNWHVEAEKAEKLKKDDVANDLFKRAAADYAIFLDRFPDSKKAYLISFYYAEILYAKMKDYETALKKYQICIERDKKGQFVEEAALGVIYSAYELMVKAGIRERGKQSDTGVVTKVALSKEDLKKQKETKIEKTPLHELEQAYVKGADQYVELLLTLRKDPEFVKKNPKRGERIPEIMFLSAETFYRHGQFEDAVARLNKIFDYDQNTKYAAVAAVTLVEAYARLHRWERVEEWCRKLIAIKNFQFKTKDQLDEFIAIAISEHANDLSKAQKNDEAVAEYIRLVKEFKGNKKLASTALMNMAVMYERAKNIKAAVSTYERVIKEYKGEEVAAEAQFVIGVIYESQTRFADAAAAFMQMEKFKAHKDAPDSIWNAGLIREAQQDFPGAIKSLQKWMDLFKKGKDGKDRAEAPTVFFKIGLLLERIGDKKALAAAADHYVKFAKAYPNEHVMNVEAYARAGDILRRLDEQETTDKKLVTKNRTKATTLFTNAINEYPMAVQELVKYSGDQKVAKNATAQAYAAQSSYRLAEYVFMDFEAVKIPSTLQIKVLKAGLIAKAEMHQKAEKAFDVVISTYNKDAGWLGCASFREGRLYFDFAKELLDVPIPKGLDPDQEDQYRAALEEFARPIQEKSRILLMTALNVAHEKGVYNKCAKEAGIFAARVDPDAFPISGEDQVKPDKTKDTLLSANFIRTLKRGSTVVDMLAKPKPEAGGTQP